MTKIKNTKKGMAKKTLSMSLVVAMLATSNVPVWAAEFSAGEDAVVTSDAETPAVDTADEFTDDASAQAAVVDEAPAVDNGVAETATAPAETAGLTVSVNNTAITDKVTDGDLSNLTAKISDKVTPTFASYNEWNANATQANYNVTIGRPVVEWYLNGNKVFTQDNLYKNTTVTIPDSVKNAVAGSTIEVKSYIEKKTGTRRTSYYEGYWYSWSSVTPTTPETVTFTVVGDAVKDYIDSSLEIANGASNISVDALAGKDVVITLPTVKTGLAATITTKLWIDGVEAKDITASDKSISVEAGHKYKLVSTVSTTDGSGVEGTIESNELSVTAATVSNTAEVTWNAVGNGTINTNNALSYTYKKGDTYAPTISKVKVSDIEYTTDDFTIGYENNTGAGNANVVLTFVQGALKGQVLRVPFTIKQADLSKATVTLDNAYVYAPTPDLQAESLKKANLTVVLDGITLKAAEKNSTDAAKADVVYTLAATAAGEKTGSIEIVSKDGNYTSSYTLKFDVAKKDLSTAYVVNPSDRNYSGKYIIPAMNGNNNEGGVYYTQSTVTAGTGVGPLTQGSDFDIDWNGTNFNKGTATATITGKGNYTGTTTATFKINSAQATDFGKLETEIKKDLKTKVAKVNGDVYEFTYTGKEQDVILPAYGLNWTLGSQYTYSYQGQHTNAGDFTVKVVGQNSYEGNSFTIKCRIVPQNVSSFTIKSKSVPNGDITVADLEYNGEDATYTPSVSITWKGMTLKEGIDYEITNVKVATDKKSVTFDIKGLGNYTGTKQNVSATILGKNINSSSITVDAIDNQTYTGSAISMKGKLTVKDGSKTLKEGKDYHIVTEKNNVKPGVATVTIAGQGNYSGERDVTFLIVDKAYNAVIVNTNKGQELPSKEYDYNTANSTKGIVLGTSEFKVIGSDGVEIDSSKYTVSYENNHAAGTATIKVTGKEGYNCSAISTFTIKPMNLKSKLDAATLTLKDVDAIVYTGEEIKPEYTIKLTDGVYTLVEGTDYEVKYSNNIDAATSSNAVAPTVTVTGLGNYAGLNADSKLPSKEAKFTIGKATITPSEVTANDVEYAGGFEASDITIKNPVSGKALVAGTDYTVTLKDATKVGAAEATIKLTTAGAKNYKFNSGDSLAVRYRVVAKDLKNATVSAIADQIVTGEQIKPTVTVMNGNIKLVEGTDYEVVYGDNKEVGEGTVTIKALDSNKNYTGSQTVKFNIVEKAAEVGQAMIADVKVSGNTVTPILSGDVDGAVGYDYVLATEENTTDGRIDISKNILSTHTNFYYVPEGTYYVYCHAWKRGEDGKKVFGEWSNIKEVKVEATTPSTPTIKSVKVKGSTVTVTYTASENATGYDVVLGTSVKSVNGERRPVEYGKLVVKNIEDGVYTATFHNVPDGKYYAGVHSYNRTSEDGKKVFSKWGYRKNATSVGKAK